MKTLLLALALTCGLSAQSLTTLTQTSGGNITTNNSDCTVGAACVWLSMPLNSVSATVQISGTFSATVQFEASVAGSVWTSITSTSGVTSATAAGTFSFNLLGQQFLRIRCSAFTSGSVRVDTTSVVGGTTGYAGAANLANGPVVLNANGSATIGTTMLLTPACDGVTDDTKTIQAGLSSAANWIQISKSGTCIISATLTINSNKTLTLGAGTTIKLANNSNVYMLENVNQSTGDTNITIEGGTWDQNYLNQTQQVPSWMGHSIWLEKCNQCTIRNLSMLNAMKFAILVSTADDLTVEDIYFNTHSDGLHGHGPWNRFTARRLHGHTGDNTVGLTISDYVNYVTTTGSFNDGLIDDINVNTDTSSMVRLVGTVTGGYSFNRVAIRAIAGTVTSGSCVELSDDSVTPLAGAPMNGIYVSDVKCAVPTGSTSVLLTASGLNDVAVHDVVASGDTYGVRELTNSGTPAIDRLNVDAVYHSGTFSRPLVSLESGTIQEAQISNIRSYNTSNSSDFGVVQIANTVPRVDITGITAIWPNNTNGAAIRTSTGAVVTVLKARGVAQSSGAKTVFIAGTSLDTLNLSQVDSRLTSTTEKHIIYQAGTLSRILLSDSYFENGNYAIFNQASLTQSYVRATNIHGKGQNGAFLLGNTSLDLYTANLTLENVPWIAISNQAGITVNQAGINTARLGTGTGTCTANAGTCAVASSPTSSLYPAADSTTAIQINKADNATHVVNIDTTNSRVGVNKTAPGSAFHAVGAGTDSYVSVEDTASNNVGFKIFRSGALKWQLFGDGSDNFKFFDNTNTIAEIERGAPANTFYIKAAGNVLVGSSTDSGSGAQLQVNGPGLQVIGGTQPTCNAAHRGEINVVGATHTTSVKDSVVVCAADGTDTYAWRTIY